MGLGIADYGSGSLSESDILKDDGKGSRTVMVVVGMEIAMRLMINWTWILRYIGRVGSRMAKLLLRLVFMMWVEVLMDVACEPRRMAAHTPQTEEVATKP